MSRSLPGQRLENVEYDVTLVVGSDGVWVHVVGTALRRLGPYKDLAEGEARRLRLLLVWRDRAKQIGGTALRLTDRRWVLTLPAGTPHQGRPFHSEPTAMHHRT